MTVAAEAVAAAVDSVAVIADPAGVQAVQVAATEAVLRHSGHVRRVMARALAAQALRPLAPVAEQAMPRARHVPPVRPAKPPVLRNNP